ncbi:MAG TPA: hypothetical protein VMT46_15005 [Anaerolineaceae bacterium]|nr:hypothetical protein [Anaerolineaceae bacterium]
MKIDTNSLFRRVLISVIAGLVLAFLISEGAYLFSPDRLERGPQTIELLIPRGTADRVAAGEPDPSLPAEMRFVQGDLLVVKNEDTSSHQLGPIWVPAGTSGSLLLDTANQYSYECSFELSRYLGVDVRPQVTWLTRLTAILTLGLPTIGLFLVYSFVLYQPKSAGGGQ